MGNEEIMMIIMIFHWLINEDMKQPLNENINGVEI